MLNKSVGDPGPDESPARVPVWLTARQLLPGVVLAAGCAAAAMAVNRLAPAASPLTICVLLGVVIGNIGRPFASVEPGLGFAGQRLLRCGVVLLGLQLSVAQVLELGAPMLAVVVTTVLTTFVGTQLLGKLLGVPAGLRMLVATGFSICGASAIAAMSGATKADRSDTVTAISMVTLYGSIAMFALPLLQGPLGLSDHRFGLWVGASVHDVAQTVAASSAAGPIALAAAVVVKLTRVVLLAPMVAGTSLIQQRRRPSGAGRRPPVLQLFVAGFLVMIVVRSTGALSTSVLDAAKTAEVVLLSMAMVGLGTAVRVKELVRSGGRVLVLGGCSWVLVAALAYGGVLLAG